MTVEYNACFYFTISRSLKIKFNEEKPNLKPSYGQLFRKVKNLENNTLLIKIWTLHHNEQQSFNSTCICKAENIL